MCPRVANSHLEEDLNLIAALLVRAGGMMEDESVALVSRMPEDKDEVAARILRFGEVAADLTALADAAKAMLRISGRQL
jgi:hypothetical protein